MFASFAAIQSASAADLALKAPPPPAPVYNWTGWYVGLNVGGSFGRAGDTSTYGAPPVPFTSTSSNLDGVIGGGQIGYNLQSGNWLVGLEADIQGTSERGSANTTLFVPGIGCTFAPCGSLAALNDTEKLPWFGTVRGRLGVLASPTWLFYVTGGLAFGEIRSNETLTVAGTPAINNFDTTRAGWTFGGGVEAALGGNWSAKLEYLYLDFGNITNTFTGLTIPPVTVTPVTLTTHVTDNVVRAGVNYHFH
jgi:outer membrane immunogenic protein